MLGVFVLEKFPRAVHDPELFVRVLEIFVVFELGAESEGHVVAGRPPLAVRRARRYHLRSGVRHLRFDIGRHIAGLEFSHRGAISIKRRRPVPSRRQVDALVKNIFALDPDQES